MKWEIYNQLKPVEREYYEKEIKYEGNKFVELLNAKWVLIVSIASVATAILAAFIAQNPKLTDAALAMANANETLIRFGALIYILSFIAGTILIVGNTYKENKWLEKLGYKFERR